MDFVRAWGASTWDCASPVQYSSASSPQKRYRPDPVPADHPETHVQARENLLPDLSGLLTYLPYFHERKQFQRDNVDRLLGPYPLSWRKFCPACSHMLSTRASCTARSAPSTSSSSPA